MQMTKNRFLKMAGVKFPLICGPMYPCSNPELVAAVSEAGGLGVVQPLSLNFVYGYNFREGLRYIRTLTKNPIGLNALIEASNKTYMERQKKYIEESLEEGVRFFITSLGNPKWVVDKVHAVGGVVFHDVTEARWAQKAVDAGVDGLICVNSRAGGHAGSRTAEELFADLQKFNLPLVCAGGVGTPVEYQRMLTLGYEAVQMGTRFIATRECRADARYKEAIIKSDESDIVLTEKLTGVPVSVINTPYIQRIGTKAGPLAKLLLRHPRAKHWMRSFYSLKSFFALKRSMLKPSENNDYWQAGKSVAGIKDIPTAAEIVELYNRV